MKLGHFLERLTKLELVFGVAASLVMVGLFLQANGMFFFATGTDKKAFMNATWKMSPGEIERANDCGLHPSFSSTDYFQSEASQPHVSDQKRFRVMTQEGIALWGGRAVVKYAFFDDELYEYLISVDTNRGKQMHGEILEAFRKKYGPESVKKAHRSLTIDELRQIGLPSEIVERIERIRKTSTIDPGHFMEWASPQELVRYEQSLANEDASLRVLIRVRRTPCFDEIDAIAANEKGSYF